MKHSLILFFMLPVFFSFSQQDRKRHEYQLEFSAGAFGLRPPGQTDWLYHLGGGVNFPGKKQGWYTNFSLNLNRRGGFVKYYSDYYTLSVGKHYQWNEGHFYGSLGFNAGLYVASPGFDQKYYRWFGTGIGVFPRGEIGWSGDKFTLCLGMYFSIGGGYYNSPELTAETGYSDHWFRKYGAAGCPYVKIILK